MKRFLLALVLAVLLPEMVQAAPTFTVLTNNTAATDGPYTTASINPTAGTRGIAVLTVRGIGAGDLPSTLSGGWATWTCDAARSIVLTSDFVLQVCIGTGSTSSGTMSIDWTPSTSTAGWVIVEVTELAAAPLVQSCEAAGASTTATCTLAAWADTTNNVGFAATWIPGGPTLSPEAGWTELAEVTGAADGVVQVEYRNAPGSDTSPSSTLSSSDGWAFIALELDQDGGGGGAPSCRLLLMGVGC